MSEKKEPKMYGDVKAKAHESNSKSKRKFSQGGASQKGLKEDHIRPAKLINRMNHPMTLAYMGEAMILPPRGKKMVADWQKLGNLPKGVTMVKQQNANAKQD